MTTKTNARSNTFKCVSAEEAAYQRQRGGDWNHGPEPFQQRYAPYGKPQKCRQCAKRIAEGEPVIEWLRDAEWNYWRTRYFIHAENCQSESGRHD